MRTACIAMAWVVVAACYTAATHTPLGNRRYAIGMEGEPPANQGELMALLHRHAARICPHGYDVVSQTSGQHVWGAAVNGVPVVGSRPDGALLVDCRTAERAAVVTAEEEASRVPRWCASSGDGDEFCMDTAASCEEQRQAAGAPVGTCVRAGAVHCFGVESLATDGDQRLQCAPTMEACVRAREVRTRQPSGWAVTTDCRAQD
jgi:hypothetical protein